MILMRNVLISIVVPVYNSANFIKRCVMSLTAQTYNNLEIILVDDGSTDKSLEICRQLQKEDQRIKVIYQENAGVSIARNTGIKVAKGEYILFVDSDDTISKEFIEKINIGKEKILYKSITAIVNQEEVKYQPKQYQKMESRDFKEKLITGEIEGYSWGYLYKTNIARQILFEEKINFMEDFVFLLRYLDYIDEIEIVDESVYYYQVNLSGITQEKKIKCNNIISINSAIHKAKKILQGDEKAQEILDKRMCRMIEKEIGKSENYHAIDCLYENQEVIAILQNILKKQNVSRKYQLYFSMILEKRYTLFKLYIWTRKYLKKLKEILK